MSQIHARGEAQAVESTVVVAAPPAIVVASTLVAPVANQITPADATANPVEATLGTIQALPVSGRGGRGGGGGRGSRGGRGRHGGRAIPDPVLPESLQAWSDDWVEVSTALTPFTVIKGSTMFDNGFQVQLRDSLLHMGGKMESELNALDEDVDDPQIFEHLIHKALDPLIEKTSRQLVLNGRRRTNRHEMLKFIATLINRTAFNMDAAAAWEVMELIAASKHFSVMSKDRYNEIKNSLRVYDGREKMPVNGKAKWLHQAYA